MDFLLYLHLIFLFFIYHDFFKAFAWKVESNLDHAKNFRRLPHFRRKLRLSHIFQHAYEKSNDSGLNQSLYNGCRHPIYRHGLRMAAISKNDLKEKSLFQLRSLKSHHQFQRYSNSMKIQSDKDGLYYVHEKEYPDITDAQTLSTLAEMSYDAYIEPTEDPLKWIPVEGYKVNVSFGFDSDGLRGYIYESDDESLLVIAIKGTSTTVFGVGGGPTGKKDKYYDNLMFSCCCAKVGWSWYPICPCASSNSTCSDTCLDSVINGDQASYVNIASKIYEMVRYMYPKASIWMTGHSLGGAVASAVALTFAEPAVTFEAPGDRLISKRLRIWPPRAHDNQNFYFKYFKIMIQSAFSIYNLFGRSYSGKSNQALKPEEIPIWHLGLRTDPIYNGQCNGVYSACHIGGYAMESKCHTATSCYMDFEDDPYSSSTLNQEPTSPPFHPGNSSIPQDIRSHSLKLLLDKFGNGTTFSLRCHTDTEKNCKDCRDWYFDK